MKIMTANGAVLSSGGNAIGVEDIITIDSTRIYAYIDTSGIWRPASDSYSVAIPIERGAQYVMEFTVTDSATVSSIFRYGQTDNITPSTSNKLTEWVRTSPQSTPTATITASKSYLVIQNGASVMANVLQNGYFILRKVI